MDLNFIRDRITKLRIERDISESQMSYDLGRSRGYIHGIVSGKAQPTVKGLLEIIEYFGITPEQFFDTSVENPDMLQALLHCAKDLSREKLSILVQVAKNMKDGK